MSKAEKKFLWYAVLAVFVLLAVILGVINIVNFTMAASDADELTQRIADQHGTLNIRTFDRPGGMNAPGTPGGDTGWGGRSDIMGPDSPEMNNSLRFFTVAYSKGFETGELIEYRISAISESEALEMADSLKEGKTGWVKGIYRYRVYSDEGRIFITVVDQGRELHPSYRILIISAIGGIAGVILSYLFLNMVRNKVFAPLKDADRKQKQFISSAEEEFKMPLTVISAQNEILEKEYGVNEQTASIRKQVAGMGRVIRKLSSLAIYEDNAGTKTEVDLSGLVNERIERKSREFVERGISVGKQIEENISFNCDADAMKKVFDELVTNAIKYSVTHFNVRMSKANERIAVIFSNDTSLEDGIYDNAFDRFTTLKNAAAAEGHNDGLGLAYVRDIVRSHGGRCSARAEKGEFILTIAL
ncbi:MAG: HAMP domain-containing histidine kinase [Clostridia bacterium]|nr:HAMP domain-containing histidine kinase [Clostridia bacterium]